jgi:AAA domain-containing protein
MPAAVLVTGMSGTGKSAALAALAGRGYATVDADDPGWSIWDPAGRGGDGDWLWNEERMSALLATPRDRPLFVSGAAPNQGRFYDRFGAVVLLSAPADVMFDRIARRASHAYGKTAAERARIAEDLAEIEPLLRRTSTHEIDTTRALSDVVAELERIALSAPNGGGRAPAAGA